MVEYSIHCSDFFLGGFGRHKKCMLLLSEVNFFLPTGPWPNVLCEARNTFIAAKRHSAVMVSAPQPQLEAQVRFGRVQLIVLTGGEEQ